MEIKLDHDTLTYYSPIYTACSSQENRAESVVSDTMPDIGSILDTDASVFLRRKAVDSGRVLLEGEIRAVLLYLGEDDSLQKLEIQMPCSFSMDAAEVQEGDQIRASLNLVRAEGKMINPRKISLTAETKAVAEVYRRESVEVTTDAEGDDLEKLAKEYQIPYAAAVESKGFVVSEEFSMPSSAPAIKDVLGFDASAVLSDQRSLGGKIILQGNVQLAMRYLSEEEDLRQERFSAAFSQLMDIPEGVEGNAEIILTPEIAYVEALPGGAGSDTVHLELHLTAQMLYRGAKTFSLLADVYSIRHECVVRKNELKLIKPGDRVFFRRSEQITLELPEPAGECLLGYVKTAVPEFADGKLRLPIQCHAFYRTQQGTIHSAAKTFIMDMQWDKTVGGSLQVGTPSVSDPYISINGGNLELRISAEVPALPLEEESIVFVTELSAENASSAPTENDPSLILVRPEGRSRWELAKAYGSTLKLIDAVNPEEEAELLLIPIAR